MRNVHGLEPLDLVLGQRERLGRERVLDDVLDLVAPTIGAVTPGLCRSQASAT